MHGSGMMLWERAIPNAVMVRFISHVVLVNIESDLGSHGGDLGRHKPAACSGGYPTVH